ncbi:MAG: ABC transporter substrate-binding protein, partial [Eubacteriales bacterium]
HNGKEVTAEDFKYSFDRLLNPKTAAKVAWILENVKGATDRMSGKAKDTSGIKVVDKYTLEITLERPYTGFLSRLTHPGAAVVDRVTVEKAGPAFSSTGAKPEVLIGTGPFKLLGWTPKNVIKIVRNEEYFGHRAYLDEVDFKIIPDETTTLNEFRAGNLDIIDRIPPGQNAVVEKEFTGQTLSGTIWGIEFYGFNMGKEPFKSNVKLRQALNFAIDREGIIKAVLEGSGVPAKGILPPGMAESSDNFRGYTYDPAKATALLAEAGYPKGQGLPEIEMSYNNRETNQKIAEAIQAQWKEIGFRTKLKPLPLPEFKREVGSGNFSIFRLGWVADYPEPDSLLYPLFSSEAGNFFGYANQEVDRLLDEAQRTTGDKDRLAVYRQAEQKIIDDAPAIMMFHPAVKYIKGKNVSGVETNFDGSVSFDKIWVSR